MTAKQLLSHPTFQLLATATTIGVLWGTIKSEVGQKAGREEVAATATKLAENVAATNAEVSAQLTTISNDIRDFRAILCGMRPQDSMCKRAL